MVVGEADHDWRSGQSRRSAPLRAIALGAPIEGQRGISTKRQGYWIRSGRCKNCIADLLAFGGCHDQPRGGRGERRAAVVVNAKRGTEATRECLSSVGSRQIYYSVYRSVKRPLPDVIGMAPT